MAEMGLTDLPKNGERGLEPSQPPACDSPVILITYIVDGLKLSAAFFHKINLSNNQLHKMHKKITTSKLPEIFFIKLFIAI